MAFLAAFLRRGCHNFIHKLQCNCGNSYIQFIEDQENEEIPRNEQYCLTWSTLILCFTDLILQTSKVKVLFQNIYSKTYLKKTKNKHKGKPITNIPQNPTSSSSPIGRPSFIATGLLWHRTQTHDTGDRSTGWIFVGLDPHQSQKSSRQGQHRAPKPRHRTRFTVLFCGICVKKPAGAQAAANIPTSQNTCWKFLWVLVPILLLSCWASSVKWPLCHTILNKN